MSSALDPLLRAPRPDRLHYALGELLGADDFRDEQTYHRGRLARALAYLHGSGTVAGLRVEARPRRAPGPDGVERDDMELHVEPGLALDRIGRLIDLPRPACLRLRWWYEYFADADRKASDTPEGYTRATLREAWRAADAGRPDGVVADLFLAFAPCERGLTPAFASGPFDALDAAQASRIRDAWSLRLVLRTGASLPRPFDPWSEINVATTPAELQGILLKAWRRVSPQVGLRHETADRPPLNLDEDGPEQEYEAGQDKTSVLLARITIPAVRHADDAGVPDAAWAPAAWPEGGANVDNALRQFVVPPAALLRRLP